MMWNECSSFNDKINITEITVVKLPLTVGVRELIEAKLDSAAVYEKILNQYEDLIVILGHDVNVNKRAKQENGKEPLNNQSPDSCMEGYKRRVIRKAINMSVVALKFLFSNSGIGLRKILASSISFSPEMFFLI